MKKTLITLSGYGKLCSSAMLDEYEAVIEIIKRNQGLFFILKAEGSGDE